MAAVKIKTVGTFSTLFFFYFLNVLPLVVLYDNVHVSSILGEIWQLI